MQSDTFLEKQNYIRFLNRHLVKLFSVCIDWYMVETNEMIYLIRDNRYPQYKDGHIYYTIGVCL